MGRVNGRVKGEGSVKRFVLGFRPGHGEEGAAVVAAGMLCRPVQGRKGQRQ